MKSANLAAHTVSHSSHQNTDGKRTLFFLLLVNKEQCLSVKFNPMESSTCFVGELERVTRYLGWEIEDRSCEKLFYLFSRVRNLPLILMK